VSIWLITGAQAAGKSTVADLLARTFERGVHVRGGQFYRWAVRGWVHFDDAAHQDEARRLLEFRYRLSAMVANQYATAGFTTVVQDNIYGEDVATWLDRITVRPVRVVVLRPSVDVIAQRDRERQATRGKVAYRGDFTPEINDRHVATIPPALGLWLDTSAQTPQQTVDEIWARADDAIVRT
jgi:adenylylsulfate kinase-like enzyme